MIKPTVGRKVWYRPSDYDKSGPGGMQAGSQPLDATIVFVHSDTMINVVVFDVNGNMHKRTSVYLWNGEGDTPGGEKANADWLQFGSYCEWPVQIRLHQKPIKSATD